MATWRVTVLAPTGNDYVYRVVAPPAADAGEIISEAHAEHTRKFAAGQVPELVGPWAVVSEITDPGIDDPHIPVPPEHDCR